MLWLMSQESFFDLDGERNHSNCCLSFELVLSYNYDIELTQQYGWILSKWYFLVPLRDFQSFLLDSFCNETVNSIDYLALGIVGELEGTASFTSLLSINRSGSSHAPPSSPFPSLLKKKKEKKKYKESPIGGSTFGSLDHVVVFWRGDL